MSSLHQLHKYCCEDPTTIENFTEASSNLRIWDCHHRLEDQGFTKQQLIDKGLYWKRPANELILLLHSKHTTHHILGEKNPNYSRVFSEEHRKRISESHKGVKNQNYGKPHGDAWNRKIGDSQRGEKGFWFGKHRSASERLKISKGLFARWKSHTENRVQIIKNKVINGEKLTKSDYCFKSRHKHLF
ncbi:MAG: hypothetical protein IK038_02985 [Bacteroidaceae bacterium]|nr:hypothetical protein [Bacteroidaceae bacterium]